MLFLFPRGLFLFRKVGFRNLALANANISTILFEVRKPTRDITVNIFSARFFISARFFFLFPQGFFLFPQGFFYFRKIIFYFCKVCFISARFTYLRKVLFISARFVSFPQGYIISARFILFPQGYFYFPEVSSFIFSIWVSPMPISTEAHKGHHCKYFSARFFFISARFFFYFRKVIFISARFFLLPQGLFYLSPQGFVHFRKVCFISARLYYFRKVYFISARLFLFPRGFIVHLLNLGLANANISTLLFEARHYAKWPGPTRTLVVTIENIFAEIKITLRK